MTEPEKQNDMPVKTYPEEEANTYETDDISQFIHKTKLQNRILKKMTEELNQSSRQEKRGSKSKS
jgi:hypothetical protein